jgi:hypothetical protein
LLCTGVCDDGTAFLWAPDWPVAKAEFYDSASSAFVALETMTDVGDPICGGVGYWPARVDCLNPVVTHSICGNCLAIEPVWLPQHHWGFLQEHPEQHE